MLTACCATGLCMATEELIDHTRQPLTSHLHLLLFGSTLLVYNTPRILNRRKKPSPDPLKFKPWYLFLFVVGLLITFIALYYMPLQLQVWSVVLGMFAFAYFLPVLPFESKRRIRDWGWLKIAVLAIVWTTATAVLPILYMRKSPLSYPFEIVLRLLFIFALCVLFDIRDMRKDRQNNIATLPNRVGIHNSYGLIRLSLLLFVIVSLLQFMRFPDPGRLLGALLTAIITEIVAIYLRRKPSDRAYAAFADGVMLVYAIIVLI